MYFQDAGMSSTSNLVDLKGVIAFTAFGTPVKLDSVSITDFICYFRSGDNVSDCNAV